jgi:hypothetical protein
MLTGQGFRSFVTSDDNNREVNHVNASTPNTHYDTKLPVAEANASNTNALSERVGTGKRARKNQKIDSDEEEDTATAEIHKIHEELEDVRKNLRKVEKGITEAEEKLKVGVWAYKF